MFVLLYWSCNEYDIPETYSVSVKVNYPEEIEGFYNNSPYVSESLVIEENDKLIVLIYPDKDYMKKHDVKESDYSAIFVEEMKLINKRLPKYSQIVNFRLQDQEFEKTPKRSIKRFLYQK